MPKKISAGAVKVTGGIFRERMDLNKAYLKELDTECLLQNFYIEAGIPVKGMQTVYDPAEAGLHWGWESPTCQLRGHFLGHWLSATAAAYAKDGDEELRIKAGKVIDGLEKCQRLNGGGYVGSIPEKFMDRLATDEYIWSPQYTLHKTIMGLTDAYKYMGSQKALEIVNGFASWFEAWCVKMSEQCPQAIYKGEQAGMLEMWAELWSITKDDRYVNLMHFYKDNYLFKKLDDGTDALTDDHANASIPLMHGAARLAELFPESEIWLRRLEAFWKTAVKERGMYVTTGSNAGEFWIPLKKHGQYIGDNDQEFCTVYNMVRVADSMFRLTGEEKYAAYIEKALYNGFLAQQNSRTGMPAYFLPLKAGAKKKWGSKRNDFWCCHGTMVQAQTLYPDLIYYEGKSGKHITVAQYIPSRLSTVCGGRNVTIEQSTDNIDHNNQVLFEEHSSGHKSRWSIKLTISCEETAEFILSLRVPQWIKDRPALTIDGTLIDNYKVVNGFINLKAAWDHSEINIVFQPRLRMETLPDLPDVAAVVSGPVVLAGLTDRDRGLNGDFTCPEEFLYPRTEHTYGTYVWKQDHFVTREQPENFLFVPLYEVTDEQYTVYFSQKDWYEYEE
ncbi:MAG: glycoside hydrolase family 127 protein [Ruminococcus sp.]|nr:glycoside hydrolase family 127 protein [Ruminococcus sp.]